MTEKEFICTINDWRNSKEGITYIAVERVDGYSVTFRNKKTNAIVQKSFCKDNIAAYTPDILIAYLEQHVWPELKGDTIPTGSDVLDCLRQAWKMRSDETKECFGTLSFRDILNMSPVEIISRVDTWKTEKSKNMIHIYDQVKDRNGNISIVIHVDYVTSEVVTRNKEHINYHRFDELTKTGKNFREQFEEMYR